jgi:dextranase
MTFGNMCVCGLLFLAACKKDTPQNNPITYGESYGLSINKDKACYNPGETIHFTVDKTITANAKIRYRHLAETIAETGLNGTSWQWTAPPADHQGYLVDIYEILDGKEKIHGSIAIDVSSDWSVFPRYGFLSKYGQLTEAEMDKVINNLARHHINGIQFQDWQFKHHQPLAGTVATPQNNWKDISNRDNYLSTVKGYISRAHSSNMKAIHYNLAFGVLNDAAADGVPEEWYLYKNSNHTGKDLHPLPKPPFTSDIYLVDPSNTAWQQYIANRTQDVYDVFGFDGYQIDQLGDRGRLYRYDGSEVDLASTYKGFAEAMKTAAPAKRLVFNAVNQYGQQGAIAEAPVDFLYTEVWPNNEGNKDLADIIQQNDNYSNNQKKTVLAAYMNYDLANNTGYFNTPSVLMTDAVIFAFGGSHLELGEHMLGKEYFPNNNLQMRDDLKIALVKYYDFMVAYENLLRDGGYFNAAPLSCTNGKMSLNNWPPVNGKVAVIGKEFAGKQVLHLINMSNASSLNWRDNNGTQPVPVIIENAEMSFTAGKTVSKIWMASPDMNAAVATTVPYTQNGTNVSFSIPSLKYWDMLVIEYQ